MITVKVKALSVSAQLPSQSKPGDAGFDLVATTKVLDEKGNFIEYGTDLAMEIPEGHVGLIFPRSSVSKTDLMQANCVGVVDSGYRGEVKVRFKCVNRVHLTTDVEHPEEDGTVMASHSTFGEITDFKVGDRIAQMIIMPIPQVQYTFAGELSSTERGDGGFGHTGN